jgi:quercetin dioxygenase-like cupin family protein
VALHHAKAGEKVRLQSFASTSDPRTTAFVKTDAFEVAQLVLRGGETIARHSVPGYATVHCLEGSVILETEQEIRLSRGEWLYLDRDQAHSVTAIEDSSLLVTILFD